VSAAACVQQAAVAAKPCGPQGNAGCCGKHSGYGEPPLHRLPPVQPDHGQLGASATEKSCREPGLCQMLSLNEPMRSDEVVGSSKLRPPQGGRADLPNSARSWPPASSKYV